MSPHTNQNWKFCTATPTQLNWISFCAEFSFSSVFYRSIFSHSIVKYFVWEKSKIKWKKKKIEKTDQWNSSVAIKCSNNLTVKQIQFNTFISNGNKSRTCTVSVSVCIWITIKFKKNNFSLFFGNQTFHLCEKRKKWNELCFFHVQWIRSQLQIKWD